LRVKAEDVAASLPVIEAHWEAYFEQTAREAKAGAQVVLWPEIAGTAFESDVAAFTARAQEAARQNRIYLGVPIWIWNLETMRPVENKLLVIDPSGAIVIEHVKYGGHIVEGGRLGDGKLQTVATPFGVLAGYICWDLDYPAVISQIGRSDTGLLLVPSNDWREIDPLHSQMAVFRAVENGTSLVRQTDAGLSIAVDPYGRVLAQVDFFGSTDRTMVAQVPVKHVSTLYGSVGPWIEWACLIGFLVVVAYALVLSRRARRAARR
jgi:apolipoprotein N-acyltransferase